MRQFEFIPAYYEWHLIDVETKEVLHNMLDPADLVSECSTLDEIESLCQEELISADITYSECDEYNGICLGNDKRLDQTDEIPAAAKIMAKALYNYYIK